MEKFLILIKDTSIKKNPTAGNQDYFFPGIQTVKLSVKKNAPLHCPLPRVKMTSCYSSGNRIIRQAEYAVAGTEVLEQFVIWLKAKGVKEEDISYSIDNHVEHVQSMRPEPAYLFEYRNMKLTCYNCGTKFSHKELIDETDEDFNGNPVEIENGCPRCEIAPCCQVEYETLEDAKYRIANQEGGL